MCHPDSPSRNHLLPQLLGMLSAPSGHLGCGKPSGGGGALPRAVHVQWLIEVGLPGGWLASQLNFLCLLLFPSSPLHSVDPKATP